MNSNNLNIFSGTNAHNSQKCNIMKSDSNIASSKHENNLEECGKGDAVMIKGTF